MLNYGIKGRLRYMNDHDLLLTMMICELLGKDVYPGHVKDAFKHAQEKLKTFQESIQPARESLLPLRQ
jgi:hypothetical protein